MSWSIAVVAYTYMLACLQQPKPNYCVHQLCLLTLLPQAEGCRQLWDCKANANAISPFAVFCLVHSRHRTEAVCRRAENWLFPPHLPSHSSCSSLLLSPPPIAQRSQQNSKIAAGGIDCFRLGFKHRLTVIHRVRINNLSE